MIPGLPEGSVLVDEIGIETSVFGHFRIEAEYQPVFRVDGDVLAVAAFEGCCVINGEGRRDRPRDIRDGSHDSLARLVQSLQLANFHYLGSHGARLILDCDPAHGQSLLRAVSHARERAEAIGEERLELSRIVCRISGDGDPDALHNLHESGVAIMFDIFSAELADHIAPKPDIVEIPAHWFGKIARESAAKKLLGPLIHAHHREGIDVLVNGITTRHDLQSAIEAGADYFVGPYLGRPRPAGAAIADEPLALEKLLETPTAKRPRLVLVR